MKHGSVHFSSYLTVFDKIGVDRTPSIPPRPPLQVVHVGLVSLRRTGDDRRLWSGTAATPVGREVEGVAFVFGEEALVALVALHGMQRR